MEKTIAPLVPRPLTLQLQHGDSDLTGKMTFSLRPVHSYWASPLLTGVMHTIAAEDIGTTCLPSMAEVEPLALVVTVTVAVAAPWQ